MENMENYQTYGGQEHQECPQEAPKKKRLGLIIGICIPVLVVLIVAGIIAGIFISKNNQYEEALELLDDGDIADAVEIHKELGDYKDLADEICDAAEDEFKSLLGKNSYKKAFAVYSAVAEYPEAVTAMDKKLSGHIGELMENYEIESLASLYGYAQKNGVAANVAALIAAGTGEWDAEYDLWYFQELYSLLEDQTDALKTVSEEMASKCAEKIDNQDFYAAVKIYNVVKADADIAQRLNNQFANAAEKLMPDWSYNNFYSLYYALADNDLEIEAVSKVIYDYASELYDAGEFGAASDLFGMTGNYADGYNRSVEALVFCYLENDWYSDAMWLISDNEGTEIYDQLLEIYISYCADATFLSDLEAALLSRIEYYTDDSDFYDVASHEWEQLSQYEHMTFYDERLQELAMDYLCALSNQMNYAEWYAESYYERHYYWHLYAADRYDVLTLLRDEYGFNPENENIQTIFGAGEQVRAYATAWYEIHQDLQWQLWGVYSEEDDRGNYLQYTNYTGYTFDLYIQNFFEDYSTSEVIHSVDGVYEGIQPEETVKVYFTFPDTSDYYYWYVDWDIVNIYSNGVLLDPQ